MYVNRLLYTERLINILKKELLQLPSSCKQKKYISCKNKTMKENIGAEATFFDSPENKNSIKLDDKNIFEYGINTIIYS
jgi:hypothetical protein